MLMISRIFPELAAQHPQPRRLDLDEKSRRKSVEWLAARNDSDGKMFDQFLTTKRGEQIRKLPRQWQCRQFPRHWGFETSLTKTHTRGDSDHRECEFPAGSSYQLVNAAPAPREPRPDFREINTVRVSPGRTETVDLAIKPGRRSPIDTRVGAKSKWIQKGRVDQSARFHGIEQTDACDIDCHKRKQPLAAGILVELILERDRQR